MPFLLPRLIKPREDIRSWIVSYGITQTIPLFGSAVTFISGAIQVPVAYALVAAAIVFASVSFGLAHFHQLAFQRSPRGKLIAVQPVVGLRRDAEGGAKPAAVKLGVLLNNIGIFRLHYEIVSIQSVADGHIAMDKSFLSLSAGIDPSHPLTFWDYEIAYDVKEEGLTMCKLKAVFKYGRSPEDLPFTMVCGFQIYMSSKKDGTIAIEWFADDHVLD